MVGESKRKTRPAGGGSKQFALRRWRSLERRRADSGNREIKTWRLCPGAGCCDHSPRRGGGQRGVVVIRFILLRPDAFAWGFAGIFYNAE